MNSWRTILAALLVASAAVFSIGVAVERSQSTHHDEATPQAAASPASNAPEGSAEREAAEKRPTSSSQPAAEASGESSEKVFGINTESVPLVVAVVIVSLLLAGAAMVWRSPLLLAAIIVVVIGAAVFDVREIAHQIDESRNGVATIAAVTAALHLMIALAAAGIVYLERRRALAAM